MSKQAKRLSVEAAARARAFLETKARPLEAARVRGDKAEVVRALEAFRNPDGGFGHALEPDLRAPESSAVATSVALRILHEAGALFEETAARSYLQGTLSEALGSWRIVPLEVESSPHAPWWNQTGRDPGYDRFSLNPTAELLGYHLAWGELPKGVLEAVTRHLEAMEEAEMHDLLCLLQLRRTALLPRGLADLLNAKLPIFVGKAVATDPSTWATYGLPPLQVVDSPDSPFLPGLEAAVEANLDHVIDTQQADGSWRPTWSWEGMWEQVSREWAGVLTLMNLRTLERFDRLA